MQLYATPALPRLSLGKSPGPLSPEQLVIPATLMAK